MVAHVAQLRRDFRPPSFDGDALLFVATENLHRTREWSTYVRGGVSPVTLPCTHHDAGQLAPMRLIGRTIEEWLADRPAIVTSLLGSARI